MLKTWSNLFMRKICHIFAARQYIQQPTVGYSTLARPRAFAQKMTPRSNPKVS